jgi:hypothetical protein
MITYAEQTKAYFIILTQQAAQVLHIWNHILQISAALCGSGVYACVRYERDRSIVIDESSDSPLQVIEVVVCSPEGLHVSSNEKKVPLPPAVTNGYKDGYMNHSYSHEHCQSRRYRRM